MPRTTRPTFRHLFLTVLAPAVLATALAGCGGGAKDFGIPSDATAQRMAQTVCTKAYECCTPNQLMGNQQAGTDEATCEAMTTQTFKNLLATISASQKQHRSTYDSTKVSTCLAHIQAASCGELDTTNHLSGVPGCDSFAIPQVDPGGACTNDWECVGGWCEKTAATPAPGLSPGLGDGTCRAFAAPGQSCETNICGKGSLCSAGAQVCMAVGGPGAACTAAGDCASGHCESSAGAAGACAAPPATSCFYASACALGPGPASRLSLLGTALVIAAVCGIRRRRRSSFNRAGD